MGQDAGVDGFRIDTVKHVNLEFWQRFAPALEGYAASLGNDDFFMFGEVYDANPAYMSRYTTAGKLQATVDFGFQASATAYARGEQGKAGASAKKLQQFFASDDWFTDGDSNVYSLPTFLGNHDMGRIGKFLTESGATGKALLQRDELAHELMFTTRGQPVVYYGDEQGFTGDGGDQDARQDMFASKVASYNDDDLIGTSRTTAKDSYNTWHPMYQLIRSLSKLREKNPALADGAQIHRYADDGPGIYAFSRISPKEQVEYVVAANSADTTKTATFPTYSKGVTFTRVWPQGDSRVSGSLRTDASKLIRVKVPGRSVVVYRATKSLRDDSVSPQPTVVVSAARRRPRGPYARRRRRCHRRPQPGDRALAHRRRHHVDRRGHGRQRAVPRLPRRERAAEGLDRGVPHRGQGPRPRPRRRHHVGRRRQGTRGGPAGRPGHAADDRLHPGQPRLRDRLPRQLDRRRHRPGRLGPDLRAGRAGARRQRPDLEGHQDASGRWLRVQGSHQQVVGRELRS